MQRLGKVDRTAQGLAIVRLDDADDPPPIGREVVDESLSTAGRIVDVFGPVEGPYVAITPANDRRIATLLDEKLYVQ
ncbi:H/ACA ribonucleoprotein complex subunit GAR1 [Natronoarchaeum rubrum]|uniref:H/ACA ribonucleoprotein complex subunit GAR1 n=1 Tax=Natronoarchaeum rubrum TaxID=755311 RepID=UPI00211255C8|nr:Gar1/Naf1 family protein [Natronoarchaeum rubrum]HMB51285.1 Gar1/Naf1 family protein [Natronoarchaeum rubrum]